jgi:hypothetical protein
MAYFRKNGVVVDDKGGIVTDQAKLTEAAGGSQDRNAAFASLPEYGGTISAGTVKIPTIGSTPSVLSSKDYAQQFQDDGTYAENEAASQKLAADSYKESRATRDKALADYEKNMADAEDDAAATRNSALRGIRAETEDTLSLLGDQYSWAKNNYTQIYDQLIKKTERLAEVSTDRRRAYGASSAQYDPLGFTAGLTEEMSKWNGEIQRLQGEKASAIQEAQKAYREGRAKALSESRKSIADADKAMQEAIKTAGERLRGALEIYDAQVTAQEEAARENAQSVASLVMRKYLDDYENGDETSIETVIDQAFKEAGIRPTDFARREAMGAIDNAILERNKTEYEEEMRSLNLIDKRQDVADGPGDGSGTYKSGGMSISKSELGDMSAALEGSRGGDGYANTELYVDAFKDWVDAGGLPKDFFSQFDPDMYANPDDPSLPPNIKRAMSKKGDDEFDSLGS